MRRYGLRVYESLYRLPIRRNGQQLEGNSSSQECIFSGVDSTTPTLTDLLQELVLRHHAPSSEFLRLLAFRYRESRNVGSFRELDPNGIVGAFAGVAKYEVGRFTLAPGEVMVIYSDGVTEAENLDGGQFGDDRLRDIAVALRKEPAANIRDGIVEAIHSFSGGCPPVDDTTIEVVRRE